MKKYESKELNQAQDIVTKMIEDFGSYCELVDDGKSCYFDFDKLDDENFKLERTLFDVDNQLKDYKKIKQALEIIKAKKVDTELIKSSEDYFEYQTSTYRTNVTGEEFDLLKEVLL